MKMFRILFLAFAVLLICEKPVGFVTSNDSENEISCYINNQGIDANVIELQDQLGLRGGMIWRARAPSYQISKVYYTTIPREAMKIQTRCHNRKARDGLTQLV